MGRDSEVEIRSLVSRLADGIRAKDVASVMSSFAPEVTSFDLAPPLRHGGGEVFVSHWRALFDSFDGPIEYEIRDLVVVVSGDIAFSYSLNRTAGKTKHGDVDRWLRWTACLRRLDGAWRIVHEHVSVPVDLASGRAVLDLQP